jgi:uncharacterized protein
VEGEKDPYYLLSDDAILLSAVNDGHVPDTWRPIDTTTHDKVVFLAPLETVSAGGCARQLFGFDDMWEVYKPALKRRWGYYTLPILYGDQLVARLDPRFDRDTATVVIHGFWLGNETMGKGPSFAEALARGLIRLVQFPHARYLDVSTVKPPVRRKHIQATTKEFQIRGGSAAVVAS